MKFSLILVKLNSYHKVKGLLELTIKVIINLLSYFKFLYILKLLFLKSYINICNEMKIFYVYAEIVYNYAKESN